MMLLYVTLMLLFSYSRAAQASSVSTSVAPQATPAPCCGSNTVLYCIPKPAFVPSDATLYDYVASSNCWHWKKGNEIYTFCGEAPRRVSRP